MKRLFPIGLFLVMAASFLSFTAVTRAQTSVPATNSTPSSVETNWTFGFRLPDELAGKRGQGAVKADILVWVPDDAKRIRSMMLIAPLLDSKNFGEHDALHKVATKHDMAILYLRNFDTGIERTRTPDPERIQKLLEIVARRTAIPEFRHAPWIVYGRSAGEGIPRGEFPFRMTWLHPKRTIASVSNHSEPPTWPVADWARLDGETILAINNNGETEGAGKWYTQVRPSLLNYRAQEGWLAHQTVGKAICEGNYLDCHGGAGWGKEFPGAVTCIRVWDYLSLFVDKALALRVPTDKYPTDGPLVLKQVDEVGGYLIDPFAIEEMFGIPRLPLREGPDGYLSGGGEDPISGFASIAPLENFVAAEGVPVVKYVSGKSPKEWLITDSFKFAMRVDPMLELGDLVKLRPKPGDQAIIDGKSGAFAPIIPKYVWGGGGINLRTGLRPPHSVISLLAYTVIEFPARAFVRVNARYSASTRVQMVINGIPVRNQQVIEIHPGRYSMLVALSMITNQPYIDPSLSDASEADVVQAKQAQTKADADAAARAKRDATGATKRILIRKAADVPEAERKKMFWVADLEQAKAWFDLHNFPARRYNDTPQTRKFSDVSR
jgi:hypothetical protein